MTEDLCISHEVRHLSRRQTKDSRLLAQVKQRDTRGLEKIMKHYTNYVATVLRNVLRDQATPEDVEELTADVFLSLWEHAPEMYTDHLTGYLASIARSKAYNHLRRKQLPQQSMEDVVITDAMDVPAQAEQDALSQLLWELLQSLSDKDREIMLRYYYYGQNVREIAAALHMKEATVKTRLHRSRGKLRVLFTERGYGYEEMEFI